MTEINEKEVYENSTAIRASYGSRELFGQWVSAAFGFTVFFFYEVVIGLPTILAMTAFIIYSIWNAVNDPLMGYVMERIHMPWERKRGVRRFPWMVIAAITWVLSYLLIYLVPSGWYGSAAIVRANQWFIFGWYLGTLFLYDFLVAIWDVNVLSLFPDKFRGLNERRSVQGAYYAERKEKGLDQEVESFFKSAKTALTNRTFVIKVLHFFGYQVGAVMIQTSAFYIVTYVLDAPAETITLLLGSMLLGALISVPLWTYFSKRVNDNRKMGLIAGFILVYTFIPFIFIEDLILWMIFLIFFGVGIGGHWFIDAPLITDVLDDIAVKTNKRQQAIYYGYQAFFARFGGTFIALTISITHILTGFIEGMPNLSDLIAASPTPEMAIFGIRIHSAIVPALFVLITVLLFWKYYDLTPDKVAANREKLEELGI